MEKFLSIRGIPQFTLIIIIVVLFGKVLTFDYNLDDEIILPSQSLNQNWNGFKEVITSPYFVHPQMESYGYRPITTLSFFLESLISGQNPKVSHSINLVLYILIALLIFKICRDLFQNIVLSFSIAAIFSLLPLHVEAVASIKNRDELLAMLFLLLAIIQLKRNTWLSLVLISIFLVLSVYSKKSGTGIILTLPIISLWTYYYNKIKYFSISIFIAFLTFLIIPSSSFSNNALATTLLLGIYYLVFQILGKQNKTNALKITIKLLPIIIGFAACIYNTLQFNLLFSSLSICIIGLSYWQKPSDLVKILLFILTAIISINAQNWNILLLFTAFYYYDRIKSPIWYDLVILVILVGLVLFHFSTQKSWFSMLIALIYLPPFLSSKARSKWILISCALSIAIALSINLYNLAKWTYIFTLATMFSYIILIFLNKLKNSHLLIGLILGSLMVVLDPSIVQLNTPISNLESISNLTPQNTGRELNFIENPLYNNESIIDHLSASLNTYGFYLEKFFIPINLSSYYGYNTIQVLDLSTAIIWLLTFISVLFTLIHLRKWRLLTILWIFLISLFPFSNMFVPVAGIVGERLMFIPSLALIIFFVLTFNEFTLNWITISTLAIWMFLLTFSTYSRIPCWKNKETLYLTDIKHQPNSVKLNELVADWYFFESSIPRNEVLKNAFTHYQKATLVYPEYDRCWFMQGQIKEEQNKPDEALNYYLKVQDYSYISPGYYLITGNCALKAKQYAIADDYLKKAISIEETKFDAYLSLINLYMKAGNVRLALSASKSALTAFPESTVLIESHIKLSEIANDNQEKQFAEGLLNSLN